MEPMRAIGSVGVVYNSSRKNTEMKKKKRQHERVNDQGEGRGGGDRKREREIDKERNPYFLLLIWSPDARGKQSFKCIIQVKWKYTFNLHNYISVLRTVYNSIEKKPSLSATIKRNTAALLALIPARCRLARSRARTPF